MNRKKMNGKEITKLYLRIRDKEASKIPSAIWVNGAVLQHRCLFLEGYYIWEEKRKTGVNKLHAIPDEVMKMMIEICVPFYLPTETPKQKIEAVIEWVFYHNASTWKNYRLPIEATSLIMMVEL